eukprot:1393030-Amorphochlora_amoeboformis.AAC.1
METAARYEEETEMGPPASRPSRRRRSVNYASLHNGSNKRQKPLRSRNILKEAKDGEAVVDRKSLGNVPSRRPSPRPRRRTRTRKKIDYARVHNGNDLFDYPQADNSTGGEIVCIARWRRYGKKNSKDLAAQ